MSCGESRPSVRHSVSMWPSYTDLIYRSLKGRSLSCDEGAARAMGLNLRSDDKGGGKETIETLIRIHAGEGKEIETLIRRHAGEGTRRLKDARRKNGQTTAMAGA